MIFDLLYAFYYSYCTSLNLPHNDCFWPSVHYQTARKVSQFKIFSGPYFSTSRLNTDSYSVYIRIQPKFGKIQTRKTSNSNTFLMLWKSTDLDLLTSRFEQIWRFYCPYFTAWRVSVFGIILVRIPPYSVQMRENADHNNSNTDTFFAVFAQSVNIR